MYACVLKIRVQIGMEPAGLASDSINIFAYSKYGPNAAAVTGIWPGKRGGFDPLCHVPLV